MSNRLTYTLITPVRNEIESLPRVAASLTEQTVLPSLWVIVDNGSSDGTLGLANTLSRKHDWVRAISRPSEAQSRGAPVVRAFHAGLREVLTAPDVLVKLDADTSMGPTYFERLLREFAHDPSLGIASGMGYERQRDGTWRQRHGTGSSVWGACRAYRWECLQDILPLEERMGWDGIDQHRANMRGWRTETLIDLPFLHHRDEGERETSLWVFWKEEGNLAYYMGYRFSYQVLRGLYHASRDPRALAMIWTFVWASIRRAPRSTDLELRRYVRSLQTLRNVPARMREARRPREALGEHGL
jgi:GT2 family glycosyltransferase